MINFPELFHLDKRKKINYQIRHDSNMFHDFVFFASYVHDATLPLNTIAIKSKKLSVIIGRECWELFAKTNDLPFVKSRIIISPVESISTTINGSPKEINAMFNFDFEIRHFFLSDSFYRDDIVRVVMANSAQGIFITINTGTDKPVVKLVDL